MRLWVPEREAAAELRFHLRFDFACDQRSRVNTRVELDVAGLIWLGIPLPVFFARFRQNIDSEVLTFYGSLFSAAKSYKQRTYW